MPSTTVGDIEVAGLSSPLPFHVVAVTGTSGGLEPALELLGALPPDPGFAMVFVIHPDEEEDERERSLHSKLQQATEMPVVPAAPELRVEANHVYVVPPGALVTLQDERLQVEPHGRDSIPYMPADHLFRSLAVVQGNRAVAVVLSGTGTDGTLGVQEIAGAQGICIAQDETARFPSMPRSAAGPGGADFVLPPYGIAAELLRIARFEAALASPIELPEAPRSELPDRLFTLVRAATGIDFSQYKVPTIRRRVHRRMTLLGVEDIDEYVALLEERPGEVQALYQDLLIRVTQFFRDRHVYQALKETVFPRLLQGRSPADPIRIWVPACATGEEVYSMAIALLEVIGDERELPIKIIGTDISDSALEKARSGTYIENIAMDVSKDRLRRYFSRVNTNYQITKSIRDMCVFARHNVVRDPPFSRLDLLSCRNLLIYLSLPLQRALMPMFHYALKPGGSLVLGTSETIAGYDELFSLTREKSRIYTKRSTTTPSLVFDLNARESLPVAGRAELVTHGRATVPFDVQKEADRVVLQKYGPAGVVIDEHWNILQFRGKTSLYLEPSPGQPSLSLQRMLREELLVEVRTLVEQARARNTSVRKNGIHLRQVSPPTTVNIEVTPLRSSAMTVSSLLVVFEEDRGQAHMVVQAPAPPVEEQCADLERELEATRSYLRTIIEDHEATNEELQSAHEEILSSNEELRSTNEELQTAKEEMQSANEELNTLNEELHYRNRELGKLNDDLENLFSGVKIPIVMVGRDLRIRRITPPAEKTFNLLPADIGRSIGDLRPNLEIPDFELLISEVIRTLVVKELEVRERGGGRWFLLRIQPYVTVENKIDGASIVAFDIDPLRRSLERLQSTRSGAEAIVDAVRQPLVLLDHELRLQRGNPAFYDISGLEAQGTVGLPLQRVGKGEWANPELLSRLEAGVHEFRGLELSIALPHTGNRVLLVHGCRVTWDGHGDAPMFLLVFEDVTELRREIERATVLAREQEARRQAESANRGKDEFLAMLAHELRNPLAPLTTALRIIRSGEESKGEWALSVAERQVRQMARIIDDLLDISRITGNKIRLQKSMVELGGAVRRVIDGARSAIEEAGLELRVRLPDESVWIDADVVRIEQIIGNLLNNAVKYTPEGGTITVETETRYGSVVARIRDSGVGISREMLTRVFDLFTQAEQASDRAKGGLGIGLTLVKRLTEMHGGTVHATSAGLGMGSEFTVELPTMDGLTPAPSTGGGGFEGPARRVLVVDDNRDAADSLSLLLSMSGHEVRTTYDGPSALDSARKVPPEVVFLDIGLPGMDGHEVARELRQMLGREGGPVLVALTGYGQEEDRRRSSEAGFDHHFVKPVDIDVLERLFVELPESGRPHPIS